MTRMTVVIAAALGVATLTAAPARAQMGAAPSVEEQIKKMEKERAAAVVKADVATLDGLTSVEQGGDDEHDQDRQDQADRQ